MLLLSEGQEGQAWTPSNKRVLFRISEEHWPFKMGQTGCPETSVRNYYYSLRNNAEERSSHDTFTCDSSLQLLTHSIWDQFLAGEILLNSAAGNIAFFFCFEAFGLNTGQAAFRHAALKEWDDKCLIISLLFGSVSCRREARRYASRLLRCLPHTAAECRPAGRPSSEHQGLFQCIICILLRNPVARFVRRITWTRDRLKRNSLFGAEDGMDLPYWLLSVLYKTHTHTNQNLRDDKPISTLQRLYSQLSNSFSGRLE
jgi:hypothetical protein